MRKLRLVFLSMLLVIGAAPLLAQMPAPTSEQIELFKSMSPEDREAIMEQLGLDPSALGDLGGGGTTVSPRRNATRDRPEETPESRMLSSDERKRLDKTIRADDSILIDIDFKKDKPARMEPQGEGLPPINVPAETAPVLSEEEKIDLGKLIDLVRSRNPYHIDSEGLLYLPGFEPIPLAGLDEKLATHRLSAVVQFLKLDVKVSKLPVYKVGPAGLKPFGYDLFRQSASTFAPVTDVPVPSDYIVGAGDQINVQLFGSANRNLKLIVGRDGRVSFPELGPINVGGRTFAAVAADLEGRVSRQMIGVRASVSMGDTRSIRVFVMGEATRPGSYTVSGLGTITSAI
jgi:hypothetical protein